MPGVPRPPRLPACFSGGPDGADENALPAYWHLYWLPTPDFISALQLRRAGERRLLARLSASLVSWAPASIL
jgi:hypothetical protein